MPYATITGQLKDSDGTAWKQATWTAVPVSPSSKPVFPDGTPVPTTSGLLDDTGHFSGQMPQTLSILPPGTTLTITITSMTSAPPLTLTKVQIIPTTTVDLGALLSPRLVAPRIKAGAIVYAYNAGEVTNPVHGNGYVNTVENQSYLFMQNSWVKIGASPNFDAITATDATISDTITARELDICDPISNAATRRAAYGWVDSLQRSRIIAASSTAQLGQFEFSAADANSNFKTYLVIDQDTGAQFETNVFASGTMYAGNGLVIKGNTAGGPFPPGPNQFRLSNDGINACYFDGLGADASTEAQFLFRVFRGDGSNMVTALQISANGIWVTGTIGATGAKTFNIPHPLGGERRLVHACLEGPENGVFYRGEAELVDGRAIVELPDYFEALTFDDDRSVLLTQVDEGGELALLAASRVVDGKFSIRSNVSAAIVSWEVKAVRRAGVDRLDVEPANRGERSENES